MEMKENYTPRKVQVVKNIQGETGGSEWISLPKPEMSVTPLNSSRGENSST